MVILALVLPAIPECDANLISMNALPILAGTALSVSMLSTSFPAHA
jgi:hypothetical protein